jgi:hypothetical protein
MRQFRFSNRGRAARAEATMMLQGTGRSNQFQTLGLLGLVGLVWLGFALTALAGLTGKTAELLGGNSFTEPAFPMPGDMVTITLGPKSTGVPWKDLVGTNSLRLSPIFDRQGVQRQWWEDESLDPGSVSGGVPGLAKYKVDPLTRRKVSGPMPVMTGTDRAPSVRLRIPVELGSASLVESQSVSFVVESRGQSIPVVMNVFPYGTTRRVWHRTLNATAFIGVGVLSVLWSLISRRLG